MKCTVLKLHVWLPLVIMASRPRWVQSLVPLLRLSKGRNYHGTWSRCSSSFIPMNPRRLLFGTTSQLCAVPTTGSLGALPRPWRYLDRTRSRSLSIFMSSVDEDEAIDMAQNIDRTWNVPGLQKEVQRLVLRCHKKVGKASQRLQQAHETIEELKTNPDATLEQLQQCPNMEALELDLNELRKRLQGLNALQEALAGIKGKKSAVVLPADVAQFALDLGVDDQPPQRPERGPAKKKGPRQMPKRLPYRRYYTADKVEIRVGKQAQDNDELSLSPEHRDGSDWWMHASGCPGSHVVIRSGDASLPQEVVSDAAALAARQSKCQGNNIKVSLTRCRDVTKPPGAKAGLVMLVGNVRTVTVNMKEAQERLDRLDKTVVIN